MGNNQSDIDISIDKIKKESSDEKGALDAEAIEMFTSKAKKCTCKILLDSGYGSGFFCRIPLGKNELINVLATCNHVLNKEILISHENIQIEINKKNKKIPKKGRRIYTNPKLDYTCIEILDDDEIDDFYSIDDINLNKNFSGENYLDKLVIIYAIMKNKRLGLSNGLIKKIQDKLFLYTCNTFPGCSGGVILNQITNCVVGVHIGEYKGKKKINLNSGIFMRGIIDDMTNNEEANFEKQIKNDNNNNIEHTNKIRKKVHDYKFYINNNGYKNYIKKEFNNQDKLRIAIVGKYSGKTVYILKILNQIKMNEKEFVDSSTSCVYYEKKLKINKSLIKFEILDTTDWSRGFLTINKAFLKKFQPNGIMIFFDLTEREAFMDLNNYKEKFIGTEINLSEIPILLIGNNLNEGDIKVKSEEAIKFVEENNFIGYYEISLNGINLNESFEFMANFLYKIYYN